MADTSSELAPQFDDLAQQRAAGTLGMWVFLATEVLFFGGLFLGFSVYRYLYPEAFAAAGRHLNLLLGSVNTVILLTSSLTMTLADRAAAEDRRRALMLCLGATALLGMAFLAIKAVEYSGEFEAGLAPVPGQAFRFEGPHRDQAALFFHLYFLMTGLHALHLFVGIVILTVMTGLAAWSRRALATNIAMSGLYWHFIDVVWVMLFSVLYLVARHG
jgi:cytochrome c oxidase subunit 3